MKYELITFSEGNLRWNLSARRLIKEALDSGYFSRVRQIRLAEIKVFPEINEMVDSKFMIKGVKGFGYWAWKPFVIKKALMELQNSFTGVVYVDAGCSINSANAEASNRMQDYFQLAEDGPLFFALPGHPEKLWSKRAAIEACGQHSSVLLDSDQLVGGISFWPNKKSSFEILDRWIDLIMRDSHSLLTDTIDTKHELNCFIEHRHDQSLMSLVAKQHCPQVIEDETWFDDGWKGRAMGFPIWATRLKSMVSIQRRGRLWDIARKVEDVIFRMKAMVSRAAP